MADKFLTEPHINEELRRLAGIPAPAEKCDAQSKSLLEEEQIIPAVEYFQQVKPAVEEIRRHCIEEMKKLDLAAEEETIQPLNSYHWEDRVRALKHLHEINRLRGVPLYANMIDERQGL